MKKSIIMFTAVAILAISAMTKAEELPYFYVGDPTVIVKAMARPGNGTERGASAMFVELETGICDKYKNCYNPFVVGIEKQGGTRIGSGVDYVFKMFKRPTRDAMRLSVGIVGFDEPLSGDRSTVHHLGLSFEAYTSKDFGAMVTVDNFGGDDPLSMFGIGLHFR